MSIDTLHPRPWSRGPHPADVYDAVGDLVAECATEEAAAHIVNATNTSQTVEVRALAVAEDYERGREVL